VLSPFIDGLLSLSRIETHERRDRNVNAASAELDERSLPFPDATLRIEANSMRCGKGMDAGCEKMSPAKTD
jgi:hypothetical protein